MLALRLCDVCFAEKPAKKGHPLLNFKNMAPGAAYEMTQLSHETYIKTHHVSPWACVSGWNIHACVFDFMHMCYLGTARDWIASSLKMMILHAVFGAGWGSDDEILAELTEEIKLVCSQHGPHGNITS